MTLWRKVLLSLAMPARFNVAVFGVQFSIFSFHFSLFTVHWSLFTCQFTSTFHFSLVTFHLSVFIVQFPVSSFQFSAFSFQFPLFSFQFPVSSFQFSVCRGGVRTATWCSSQPLGLRCIEMIVPTPGYEAATVCLHIPLILNYVTGAANANEVKAEGLAEVRRTLEVNARRAPRLRLRHLLARAMSVSKGVGIPRPGT